MTAFSISADTRQSKTGPKLKKGKVKIYTTTTIYWTIGENPMANAKNCALLRAGDSIELHLPVGCSRLAVLAAVESGNVTVVEIPGGVKASCAQ